MLLQGVTLQSMKLSVSVPDQLWEQAQAADGRNPSQLVQEALRRLVEETDAAPAYAPEPPDEYKQAIASVADRLSKEAGAEFLLGYQAAANATKELPWFLVEQLAEHFAFNVTRWANNWRDWVEMAVLGKLPPDDADPPDVVVTGALRTALGTHASPYDKTGFTPSATYLKGFERAMRDLWALVTTGEDVASKQARRGALKGETTESASPIREDATRAHMTLAAQEVMRRKSQ